MKLLLIGLIMFGLFGCSDKKQKKNSTKEEPVSTLMDSIKKYPNCKIFKVENSNGSLLQWAITPTELKIIPHSEAHFLVIADIIDKNKSKSKGYINLNTPERIADYVIYDLDNPKVCGIYDLKEKEVIPSVASDCFGLYEMYYSKFDPEIGIETLKKGLELSTEKSVIAEDIGYILRDENRLNDALKYFLISEKLKPSSEYILGEIEDIYKSQGNEKKAEEYRVKFEQY